MTQTVYPWRIVAVFDEYRIAVNAGIGEVQQGQDLEIYEEVGDEIIDPDSGDSLGRVTLIKARVRVTQVEPLFCIAESAEQEISARPQPGGAIDLVRALLAASTPLGVGYGYALKPLPLDPALEHKGWISSEGKAIRVGDQVRPVLKESVHAMLRSLSRLKVPQDTRFFTKKDEVYEGLCEIEDLRLRQESKTAYIKAQLLLQSFPDEFDVAIMSATVQQEIGQFDKAFADLHRAEKLNAALGSDRLSERRAEIEFRAGMVFEAMQQHEEAMKRLKKALELSPNDPRILMVLGVLLWYIDNRGRAKEALELSELALKKFNAHSYNIHLKYRIMNNMAYYMAEIGTKELLSRAQELAEAVVVFDNHNHKWLHTRGFVYKVCYEAGLGEDYKKKALDDFKEALRIDPGFEMAIKHSDELLTKS